MLKQEKLGRKSGKANETVLTRERDIKKRNALEEEKGLRKDQGDPHLGLPRTDWFPECGVFSD